MGAAYLRAQQQAEQAAYERCVACVRREGSASIALLQQECACSYSGAIAFLERMNREGILAMPDERGLWQVVG